MTNPRKRRLIERHAFLPGGSGQRCRQVARPGDAPCNRPADDHQYVGVEIVRPELPAAEDVFSTPVRVGGMTVSVDRAGMLVLTVPTPGAFTISNLDSVIADLELARAHARRYERHPEHYRPEADPGTGRQCCADHAPVEAVQCCDDCPGEVEQAAAEVTASLSEDRRAEIEAAALLAADAFDLDDLLDATMTPDEQALRLALLAKRAALPTNCPACGSSFAHTRIYVAGEACGNGWHSTDVTEEEFVQAREDLRVMSRNSAPPIDTISPTNVL